MKITVYHVNDAGKFLAYWKSPAAHNVNALMLHTSLMLSGRAKAKGTDPHNMWVKQQFKRLLRVTKL